MGLAAAVIAIGATGIGVSAIGQYQAGQAAEAQAKSQREWHEYNAGLAEREAAEARDVAAKEETRLRKGGERLKATQRARFAKAGVTTEGSPALFLAEQAIEIEEDALMIRRGGQLAGQRLTAEAGLSRMAGRSALLRGKASLRASRWGMASTGLSGAAGLGYQYGSMTGRWP